MAKLKAWKSFSVWMALVLIAALGAAVAPAKPVEAANGDVQTLNVAKWTAPTTALASAVRPTVLLDGTTYHMWYVSSKVVYHTSSTDPASFATGTAVTGLVTSYQDCAFVMKEGDTYYMLNYGDGTEKVFSIFTSSDGIAWTAKGKIYDGTGLNDWAKMDRPKLLKESDGTYKMYFQVKSNATDNPYYIYLATTTQTSLASIADGNDDNDFTLVTAGNPVLSPTSGEWDGLRVMQPMVVKDGSNYYMWYVGYGTAAKIGFAFSSDGISWTKGHGNPILAGATEVWTPSVLKVGSTYHMWNQWDGTPHAIQYISANAPIQFSTIQSAVTAANPGDTIKVAAGTYDEQVVINKSLTLQGAGDTTIIKPSSAAKLTQVFNGLFWYTGTKNIAGIIVANVPDGSSVTVKDLKVDESSVTTKPTGTDYLAGIFYRETAGIVDTASVVGGGAWSGYDRGYGMYLSAATNTVSVEVKNSSISNWDKNGIEAHGNKLTANIHHNTLTGRSPAPSEDEVPNGVNIGRGALGMVNNNTITTLGYEPETWLSAGILFSGASNSSVADGNTITDCQIGIAFDSNGGSATGNTVTGGTLGDTGLAFQNYLQSYLGSGTWTASFVNNTVNGFKSAGIEIWGKAGTSLTATITGNQLLGGDGNGVDIGGSGGNITATITNNTISGWAHGVNLDSSLSAVNLSATIRGNTIQNNVGAGSGVHVESGVTVTNVHVNFNNIVGNSGTGVYGVSNEAGGILDANNNWWGANNGPGAVGPGSGDKVSANVNFDPWLVIGVSANPTSIVANGTSTSIITADMTKNSAGAASGGFVPNGTQITFTTDKGSIGSLTIDKPTTNGKATATLTSSNTVEVADVTASANVATATTAVFFTKAGTTVTGSKTTTISGPGTQTNSSTGGNVTIDGTGSHTITTATYSSNPGGTPSFQASGNYYDVHLDNVAGVNSLTIQFCPGASPTVIYYWNETSWVAASNQIYQNGCIVVTVTPTTFPSLADLSGLVFASGRPSAAAGAGAAPAPKPFAESSSSPQMPEQFISSPAKLSIKYLNVQPQQAQANQPVTIYANIANRGDEAGSYTATLKINGQVEETRTGRVGGHAAVPLKFEVLRDKPGTYNVDINGQKASFTIVGASSGADTSNNIPMIGLIVFFIVVIVVAVLLVMRRRAANYY